MPSPSALRRNVELKVRLTNLNAARRVARQLATSPLLREHQVDTYYHARAGRLKLRVIDGARGQLVWYDRPDTTASKTSRYRLIEVNDPAATHAALEAACGVLVVVDKRREIYLHENVRIHLDRVAGLGTFLEFEAVLAPREPVSKGRRQLLNLVKAFGLTDDQRVPVSYSDLLIALAAGSRRRVKLRRS